MEDFKIETIEIDLLLEAIFKRYGHDFRHYAKASIGRRVRQFLAKCECGSIAEMIPRVLHDELFFERMVREFSITVTEMFRDPYVYRAIREKVAPLLKSYPYLRVWHAGCATGEEAYSLSIVLKEEDLYDRTIMFATDFNDVALEKARDGIYELERVKHFTRNYQDAGGLTSFSEYYHAHYGSMAIQQTLKKNITFANHNLVTDSVFGEMNFILCRNVLIYFDKELQQRVLNLFLGSLAHGGYLCLGSKESLLFTEVHDHFRVIDEKARIYQKII